MQTSPLVAGATPAAPGERRALLAGDQLALVERFAPLLRRANFDVRRAPTPAGAMRLVEALPFDLLIVALPFPQVRELLDSARAPGSPCLHASVVLVGDDAEPALRDERVTRLANRVLTAQAPPEETDRTVAMLLDVAPRVDLSVTVRVRLAAHESAPRLHRLENLSTSGMLLSGGEPLPLGSLFGFDFDLPDQPVPIRGQARVVRHTVTRRPGEKGFGATFVAVGGEGPETLRRIVLRERQAASPRASLGRSRGAVSAKAATPTGPPPAARDRELAAMREELAELDPFVDDLLRRSLPRRLGVADWYLTGVELGLESLAAFGAILETVYRGQSGPPESGRRIADLLEVRKRLEEFAQPQRGLDARVEILVALRPALERLLRELAHKSSGRSVVHQLAADIQRVVRGRRSLEALRGLLRELEGPRFLFARGALHRRARDVYEQYRGFAACLGMTAPETLTSRAGRRDVLAAAEREAQRTAGWLTAIHAKVYTPRLRRLATGDPVFDLAEQRLEPVLAQVLASGYEYLERAYSAYRHALEMSGADGALLDRVAALGSALESSGASSRGAAEAARGRRVASLSGA